MSRFHDGILPLIASNMAWVENILNLTNSYYKVTSSEGDKFEYLVPFPPGYACYDLVILSSYGLPFSFQRSFTQLRASSIISTCHWA